MTKEQERIKSLLIGKWEVMNTPGILSHYTYKDGLEIYFGSEDPSAETMQKTYTIETKDGKTFIKKADETVEIGGISRDWMLWVKGKKFFVLKKV